MYIVLNGRLRSVRALESGKKEIGDEYGRGEFVGLVRFSYDKKTIYQLHHCKIFPISHFISFQTCWNYYVLNISRNDNTAYIFIPPSSIINNKSPPPPHSSSMHLLLLMFL